MRTQFASRWRRDVLCASETRVMRERQPELVVRLVQPGDVSAEAFRRNADHGVFGAVDRDRSSDDVGIAAEAQLPRAMADHRLRFRARRIVHRREAASERQRDADGREVVARHVHRGHRHGGSVGRLEEAFAAAPPGEDHPACRVADVEVVRVRPGVDHRAAGLRPELSARADDELRQAVLDDARRRAENRTHEDEDGDDDTHAEAEGGDADCGERPRADQGTGGVTKVGDVADHWVNYGECVRIVRAQPIVSSLAG